MGEGDTAPQFVKKKKQGRERIYVMNAFYLREPANIRIFPLRLQSQFNLQVSFWVA